MNKLIKLSYTHYIIVDDSEIKEGDKSLLKVKGFEPMILTHFEPVEEGYEGKKITHSTKPLECDKMWTPLNGKQWMCNNIPCCSKIVNQKVKPLSLSEVEEAINGYNVEKMAEQDRLNCGWDNNANLPYTSGYIRGFKAHQELVKDKLFTIEDMINAYIKGTNSGALYENLVDYDSSDREEAEEFSKTEFEDFKKSLLPKTEWSIEFDEQGKIKLL